MSFLGLNWKDVVVGGATVLGSIAGSVVPGLGTAVGGMLGGAIAGGLTGGAIAGFSTGSWTNAFKTGLGDALLGAIPGGLLGHGAGTLLDRFGIQAGSDLAAALISDPALEALGGGVGAAIVNHFMPDSKTQPSVTQLPVKIIQPSG